MKRFPELTCVVVVGVCRLYLHLPENESLKGKRSVVRGLIERVRARFNVAAAEVGRLDEHEHAELAFVVVSGDNRHANAMLSRIVEYCEQNALADVAATHIELIPMGKPVGAPMAGQAWELPRHWTGS